MYRKNLGGMLVDANLIDEVQMQIALAEQKRTGKRFGSTLVDLKFIDENVLAAFLSKQIDIPCISLLHIDIPKKVLRRLSRDVAVALKCIPVRGDATRLEVAMVDPSDLDAVATIEKSAGVTVIPLIAPESSIQTMIDRCYPTETEINPDDTMAGQHRVPRNISNDPVFWDLIAELESGDLDDRLDRIERRLDQLWVLVEKVLRNLEREGADRAQR